MKKSVFLFLTLLTICSLMAVPAYADGGAKKHHSKTKHALHELKEAQTILTKITPDAEGHSVKAAQHIDLAMQELSQIKEVMPDETQKVS